MGAVSLVLFCNAGFQQIDHVLQGDHLGILNVHSKCMSGGQVVQEEREGGARK